MSKTGDIMVAERSDENLGLMLQPPEGLGMDDSVPVSLEAGSHRAGLFPLRPAPAKPALGCERGKKPFFPFLRSFANVKVANHRTIISSTSQECKPAPPD